MKKCFGKWSVGIVVLFSAIFFCNGVYAETGSVDTTSVIEKIKPGKVHEDVSVNILGELRNPVAVLSNRDGEVLMEYEIQGNTLFIPKEDYERKKRYKLKIYSDTLVSENSERELLYSFSGKLRKLPAEVEKTTESINEDTIILSLTYCSEINADRNICNSETLSDIVIDSGDITLHQNDITDAKILAEKIRFDLESLKIFKKRYRVTLYFDKDGDGVSDSSKSQIVKLRKGQPELNFALEQEGDYRYAIEIEKKIKKEYVTVFTTDWKELVEVKSLPSNQEVSTNIEYKEKQWNVLNWSWNGGISDENIRVDGSALELTLQKGSGIGAQADSIARDFHYGTYTVEIENIEKTSCHLEDGEAGRVAGAFYYSSLPGDFSPQEIDIEILSSDPEYVNFVVHNNLANATGSVTRGHYRVRVPNYHDSNSHEYGFKWEEGKITFFIDGQEATHENDFVGQMNPVDFTPCGIYEDEGVTAIYTTGTGAESFVPSREGSFIFNHWTRGWGHHEGIQKEDAVMRVLNFEYTPEGPELQQIERTKEFYPADSDLTGACQTEFGPDYRVADWNEIKSYTQGMSNTELSELMDYWDLIDNKNALLVRGGQKFWQSNRQYFMTRHDGSKPGYYLAHDNISSFMISLGSWYPAQGKVMCYKNQ